MKRLLLILLFALPAQAASEIRAFEAGATTCFTVVRETDGDVWYVVGQVFEAWGTGARTAADYDIALTDKSGGMFVGNMDTNIGAGQYYIVSHMQIAGAPADTDPAVYQEYGDWDGTTWTPGTLTAGDTWEELVADHTTETTYGGEVGGLDPNVTLILADTEELQTDHADGGRLDLIWDAIKAMTDLISINTTTVSDANDANSFTLTAGEDTNDAYFEHIIMVEDADDSHAELRYISEWNATRVLLVEDPFSFTPAIGDNVWIMGTGYGGYLYEIWNKLWRLQSPVFYYQGAGTSGGGTGGAGGVTQYDSTGNDP